MARKILLADDSVTAQNMGRKILTDAGYEVVTVNNGSAALKKIFEVKPDVIVLDVYMPGYSGLEVCQRIKENKDSSRIPILLTVGKLEPFKPEEARRVRADAFVVKPFEASELLAALARLEDKIVPQPEPYKPGRFARAVAAVDDQVAVDKDETWKNRLRIPTHESQPEPEPEMPVSSKVLRELHSEDSGKHEAKREGIFERPMPAGLPADITPEEIAAISAAAAQLKATATHGQVVEPKEQIAEPAEPTPVSTATAPAAAEPPDEEASPVTFASAPEAPTAPTGPSLAETAETKNTTEPESEPVTAAIAPHNVDAAPVVEAPAAQPETAQVTAPEIPAEAAESATPVISETTQVEATSVSPSPDTPTDAPPEVASTPAPPPADDEVMAALQSLMPATTSPDPIPASPTQTPSNVASSGMAAIAAQVNAASLTAHAAGPRWIAEEVALSDEEASLSLEREMEVAYAAVAASGTVLATSAAVAESPVVPTTIAPPEYSAVASPAETTHSAVYAMAAGATESATVVAPVAEHASSANIASTLAEEITASAAPVSAPSETSEAVPITDDSNLPDSQTSGGLEDMAASWKNIRDSIATSSGASAAPAKEKKEISLEPATSESSAPASETRASTASDPKAIASIVDSVLAELRPKIVEEIAKKLADTKKD